MTYIPKLSLKHSRWKVDKTPFEPAWVNNITSKVLTHHPDLDNYICSSGISPSGVVHAGNLRDVMTSYFVATHLRALGREATIVMSWDNFDRFRSIPRHIPASYNQYLGMALSSIPDPEDWHSSYAQGIQARFEKSLNELGIDVKYRDQTKKYHNGDYDEFILTAMARRHTIADILHSFKSSKKIKESGQSFSEFKENYFPISIYSRFTGKDNTRVVFYDEGTKVTYKCLDTGKFDTIDIKTDSLSKLHWKVDWAMRWKYEGTVFEPGGHDHASPGGSYEVASEIAKHVFDHSPPLFAEYKFVGIGKKHSKMSGSRGEILSPKELVSVYEPSMVKWLYLKHPPSRTFNLSFGNEVFGFYKNFDSLMKRPGYYINYLIPDNLQEHNKNLYTFYNPVTFRQTVAFGAIVGWDLNTLKIILQRRGIPYQSGLLESRLSKAKYWFELTKKQSPFIFRTEVNRSYANSLELSSRELVQRFRKELRTIFDAGEPLEKIEGLAYRLPREQASYFSDIKMKQRRFFRDLYNLLCSQDSGPRISTLLWLAGRARIENLLDI